MKKFFVPLCAAAIAVCAALFAMNAQSPGNEIGITGESAAAPNEAEYGGDAEQAESVETAESAEADAGVKKIKKYILKNENDKIVLICSYTDNGVSKIEVPSINPDYLTELDRERLAQGIELNTTEEVYKLIEDYSS